MRATDVNTKQNIEHILQEHILQKKIKKFSDNIYTKEMCNNEVLSVVGFSKFL